MPTYERSAYVIVEADSPIQAEKFFAEIDGTTHGFGDVTISLDDSPAECTYDEDDA